MKFIKILLVSFLLIGMNLSCTKLDEKMYSQVSPDNFFKTDEEFSSALGDAYYKLNYYMDHNRMLSLQEATTDELVVPTRGKNWDDGGQYRNLHTHNYTPTDTRVMWGWDFCYKGINSCNRLIYQFAEVKANNAEKYIAELKVLRALYYYWALDMYGNIPIVTDFNATSLPTNTPRKDVYAFVEKEILDNIDLLTKEVGGTAYARVNYYTAQALLAKLYLNAEVYSGTTQWSKAAAACDVIINSGKFKLATNYYDNFKSDNQNSTEFIFAIPFDAVFFPGFSVHRVTLHYGSQATYNLTFTPYNGHCTTKQFYDSYEDKDIRKKNFIVGPQYTSTGARLLDPTAEPNDPDGPPVTFTPQLNELGPNCFNQAGARVGKWEIPMGSTANLNNDVAVFRYADVLLMKAEALFRQGQTGGEALNLVNKIRARAGVADFASLTAENLLAERGREMFCELTRRTDLIRFGKYNDAFEWHNADADKHVNIFPIPNLQINANKNLVQNPGY